MKTLLYLLPLALLAGCAPKPTPPVIIVHAPPPVMSEPATAPIVLHATPRPVVKTQAAPTAHNILNDPPPADSNDPGGKWVPPSQGNEPAAGADQAQRQAAYNAANPEPGAGANN